MSSLGSPSPLLFGAAKSYEIEKSLRFNSDDSAYLNKTWSGDDANLQKQTYSFWFKRGKSAQGYLFTAWNNSNTDRIGVLSDDQFFIELKNGSSTEAEFHSDKLLRDVGAWYHAVVAFDTTQSDADDRMKVWINGELITTWDTKNTIGQNYSMEGFGRANKQHVIGAYASGSSSQSGHFDGYMTEFYFIDGQQLTASSFGEINEKTGQWVPIKYTGTYGNKGWYIDFSDSSTFGKDYSGNSQDFTPANLSNTTGVGNDSLEDTPTNNFCVLNPNIGNGARSGAIASNGNLDLAGTDESTNRATFVFGPGHITSGKWYWEITSTGGANGQRIGLSGDLWGSQGLNSVWFRGGDVSWFASNSYKKYTQTSETSSGSYTSGDVTGVAYNADDGEIKYYKNGTLALTDDTLPSVTTTEFHIAVHGSNTGSNNWPVGSLNFGQRAFAHTPPTGYKKLCSANLSTPTIKNGQDHFGELLYTGTATTVNGLNFNPDLYWIKSRSGHAGHHNLFDKVRGIAGDKIICTNTSGAEGVEDGAVYGSITAATGGFTLVTGSAGAPNGNANFNQSGATYVVWNWLAGGGSTSSNGDGDITSTVSVNSTAGFSIVTYTGTGTDSDTIGHGLGVTPGMVIIKRRDNGSGGTNWRVWHKKLENTKTLELNGDASEQAQSDVFDTSTPPTSSVFRPNNHVSVNGSGGTYVAYCFADVEGYSKTDVYRGNGNNDGSFVYLGFKPAFIMLKNISTSGTSWRIYDSKRPGYNDVNDVLYPNTSGVEANTDHPLDFFSNGIKARGTFNEVNADGNFYIFVAFAESPFKYANAG